MPPTGVTDGCVAPNVVVLPNGRIVDAVCRPVPNVSGCDAAGAGAATLAAGFPNVNVEFNAVGATVPGAAAPVEPKRNPVLAGAAAVDVAPKATS